MATKYDQSSATRPVSIRSHTSAFQVHFKHTSSALEMSSVNPPTATEMCFGFTGGDERSVYD